MGAYKANSGPSEEGGWGRRYWVGECLKQCRVFWVRLVFHFMVLQLSGLLRSSQEAMSYFEHASSPGCVSLSASEMRCFLLQMHFSVATSKSLEKPNPTTWLKLALGYCLWNLHSGFLRSNSPGPPFFDKSLSGYFADDRN